MSVREQNLYDRIVENARLFRDKPAFTFRDRSLSFGEYLEQVNQISHGLLLSGLKKGERIAILMDNNLEYMLIYGACAQTGLIAVGINTRTSADEMKLFLEKIEPEMIIFEQKYEDAAKELKKSFSSMRLISNGESSLHAKPFAELIDPNQSPLDHLPSPGADEGLIIIATAATDGVAKGALLSHRNILTSNLLSIAEYGKSNIQGYLAVLPLFHVSSVGGSMATFHLGGHTVIMSKFEPAEVVKNIDHYRLTYFSSFPPILENVLNAASEKKSSLESLKMVSGIEFGPANIERLHQESKAEYWLGFGQTETMGFVTYCPSKERPGSAGRPSLLNSVAVVDEYDRPLAPGEEGEIVVRGENVFLQYWGMEDTTEHTLRNGWHHCGDIGKFDEEGYLWYVKPKEDKELIKTGGENVYPGEVETVLLKHPEIEKCVVIGVASEKWGRTVKAICQLKAGATLTFDEVAGFVGEHIAGYKKPKIIEFVKNLPEKDGKVDRSKVKELYE
ncbi:MAG: AMP-binding protein [SAR324 cluster bacterium]|nr:AMP-binding protein [SAR324 cluster bacterium]